MRKKRFSVEKMIGATGLIVWNQPMFSLLKSARIPDLNSEETYFRVASEISKPHSQGGIIMNCKL